MRKIRLIFWAGLHILKKTLCTRKIQSKVGPTTEQEIFLITIIIIIIFLKKTLCIKKRLYQPVELALDCIPRLLNKLLLRAYRVSLKDGTLLKGYF